MQNMSGHLTESSKNLTCSSKKFHFVFKNKEVHPSIW